MMMNFSQIATADLDTLNDELAAAGQDSTQTELHDALDAVARLINQYADLCLYDSETNAVVTSSVTDDQAAESAQTPEGHIMVDGRKCYVSN